MGGALTTGLPNGFNLNTVNNIIAITVIQINGIDTTIQDTTLMSLVHKVFSKKVINPPIIASIMAKLYDPRYMSITT